MTIEKTISGRMAIYKISGALDTETSPMLEEAFTKELADIDDLTLDFEELEYVSSAGLRVIISARKMMKDAERMKIIHVNESIMEIFEITGFTTILNIE